MSYKVNIALRAKEQITSWGLSRKLLLEVYQRLHQDLAGNPDGLLGAAIIPYTARAYSIILEARQSLPYKHWCVFAIEQAKEKKELQVLFGRHSIQDTGENLDSVP